MGFLTQLLGGISGNSGMKVSEQLLFDKVIGFKSIVPGCGASMMVQNIAIALAEKTKYNICVLDTNFLYPIQAPLLGATDPKNEKDDLLNFAGELSRITVGTPYSNLYLVSMKNRTLVDMLSGKDAEASICKLIDSLKSYFDIVIIDIASEFTNTSAFAAIKCNKIFLVADTSLKCIYNIKKAVNTLVTVAVPVAKAKNVILNKSLDGALIGAEGAIQSAGLTIIGSIPMSYDIATLCASGKPIYGAASKNAAVSEMNTVIDTVIENISERTPLNETYLNVGDELARRSAERRTHTAEEDQIVESIVGSEDMQIGVNLLDEDSIHMIPEGAIEDIPTEQGGKN